MIFNGIYSTIIYPIYTVISFPGFYEFQLWVLVFSEILFLIDLIMGFFKQRLDERKVAMKESLE